MAAPTQPQDIVEAGPVGSQVMGGSTVPTRRKTLRSCKDDKRLCKQSSASSDSTDASEDELSEAESRLGQYEYDSDDFAKDGTYNFKLSTVEVTRCFTKLKCRNYGPLRKTSTSIWSRTISASCAAYKLFKIKRWNLKDENLIFDPLQRMPGFLRLKPSALLWHNEDISDVEEVSVQAQSVDGLLYKTNKPTERQSVMENLMKLDELLEGIDWPSVNELPNKAIIDKANQTLPERSQEPFYRLVFALHYALRLTKQKRACPEMVFQNLFSRLFNCVANCLGEKTITCDTSIDGMLLDKFEVEFPHDELCRVLRVSSVPDLFLYQNIDPPSQLKRGIAVVEVKGKDGDKIIHSDDEDDDAPGTNLSAIDETSEDSEEELPVVEKTKHKKHKDMTKMKKKTRRYMRRFLPQIIGEIICFNETTDVIPIQHEDPGFSFGVAVIGFDVHFLSMVTSNGAPVSSTLSRSDAFTHVFVTRPLSILNRRERRIIVKTLATACCMQKPLILGPDDIDCLRFHAIKLNE